MLLLANVRGTILAKRWEDTGTGDAFTPAAARPSLGVMDKIANRLPDVVWPRGRFVFYPAAAIMLLLLVVSTAILPQTARRAAARREFQRQQTHDSTVTVQPE